MHPQGERVAILCALFAIVLHIFDKRNLAAVVACFGIASILCVNVPACKTTKNRGRHCLSKYSELFDMEGNNQEMIEDVADNDPIPENEYEYQEEEEDIQYNDPDIIPHYLETEMAEEQSDTLLTDETQDQQQVASNFATHNVPITNKHQKLQIMYDPEERYGDFIAEHSGPPAYVGRWRTTTQWNHRVGPPPIAPNPMGRDRLRRIEPVKTNHSYNSRTGRLSRYAWLT
jgi:hypothetical protein